MIRTFRTRLALLSALLSGLVLLAFGLSTWSLIRAQQIAEFTNKIVDHAEREVNRQRDPQGWQRTMQDMANTLGIRHPEEMRDISLLVQDDQGQTLFQSNNWPNELTSDLKWPTPPRCDGPPEQGPRPAVAQQQMSRDNHSLRLGLAATTHTRIAIAVDQSVVDRQMADIRNMFWIALPISLALIACGSWLFSWRALQPVLTLTTAVQQISVQGLSTRVTERGADREFSQLIRVFNEMLARLERSFVQTRRFSADAAHELKTPLAILQGQLERAIQKAEVGSCMQKTLADVLDEVRRLSTISAKLLLLSQADAGHLPLQREEVDVSSLLDDLIDDIQMLAPSLTLWAKIEPNLTISCDTGLLLQVLHNLISNAIKYNVPDGWIELNVSSSPTRANFTLRNPSEELTTEQSDHLFERFYRTDPARSRKVDGVGLGLSICREIIRTHGGDISLQVDSARVVSVNFWLPRVEPHAVLPTC